MIDRCTDATCIIQNKLEVLESESELFIGRASTPKIRNKTSEKNKTLREKKTLKGDNSYSYNILNLS